MLNPFGHTTKGSHHEFVPSFPCFLAAYLVDGDVYLFVRDVADIMSPMFALFFEGRRIEIEAEFRLILPREEIGDAPL